MQFCSTLIKLMLICIPITLVTAPRKVGAQNAVISLENVKVYSLPMEDDTPVVTLSKGDTVRIIGRRADWVKVEFAEQRKGWMQLQVRREGDGRNGFHAKNGSQPKKMASNGAASANGASVRPDIVRKPTKAADSSYRRFGYSFGFGLMELDFTYNWKFVFHSTPKLAMEGSFKHVLGKSADSYFLMVNWSYLLKEHGKILPYVTGGLGVINTVPDRSIGQDGVSHMAINYGVTARKHFKNNMSFVFGASQYTVFVGSSLSHFREITFGFLVGKFWN